MRNWEEENRLVPGGVKELPKEVGKWLFEGLRRSGWWGCIGKVGADCWGYIVVAAFVVLLLGLPLALANNIPLWKWALVLISTIAVPAAIVTTGHWVGGATSVSSGRPVPKSVRKARKALLDYLSDLTCRISTASDSLCELRENGSALPEEVKSAERALRTLIIEHNSAVDYAVEGYELSKSLDATWEQQEKLKEARNKLEKAEEAAWAAKCSTPPSVRDIVGMGDV